MLQNLVSIRQFRLTKWSFLDHSSTPNAPYIRLSHDSGIVADNPEWFLWLSLHNV